MPAVVDVLIPVFNGEQFVKSSVESIQVQTVKDIRILIVDDGSTDSTSKIIEDLSLYDPRINIISKANGGIVDALNVGLAHSNAEFIARHDADDIAYAHRLETQLAYLQAHPDCIALGCAARHIDEAGDPTGSVASPPQPDLADPIAVPCVEPYLIHPFLMVRRDAITTAGGYRHVLNSEDTDLYWRLQERGRLHNLDQVLGDYRMHAASISGGSVAGGRVMAVSSQLTAISTRRRRAGRPDIAFDDLDSQALRAKKSSLAALFAEASRSLTSEERDYLQIAASAKLLELTSYRPYEIDLNDCRFLRAAADQHLDGLKPQERALLHRRYSGTASRLAASGKWKEAEALVWPSLWPATLWRLALRMLLSDGVRSRIRKLFTPTRSVSK